MSNFTNSPLVSFTRISPNKNSPRNQPIRKITIHHFAGRLSVESLGEMQANPARQSSYNYGIGPDGRIGLIVDERDRCWATSSPANDHQAVVIGVSNSSIGGDWPISDESLTSLTSLMVDICRRNNITRLNWTGDATGNVTIHRWFAATACPATYLETRIPGIVAEVNRRLGQN